MKNNKIVIILLLCFFCFATKAQNRATDALEKAALDYLENKGKKNKSHTVNKSIEIDSTVYSKIVRMYPMPNNKYIICIYGFDTKPCLGTASEVYKIAPYGESKNSNLYFINDFISPITLNEENTHFFLTDKECENDRNSVWRHIIIRMLLLDDKFSIIKEFEAFDYRSSEEDILCPTISMSLERARMRKKYGHL